MSEDWEVIGRLIEAVFRSKRSEAETDRAWHELLTKLGVVEHRIKAEPHKRSSTPSINTP